MAKFKPGNSGRPAGSKNKNVVRSRLADYVGAKWDVFEQEMGTLTGKAYVENFIRLLPFVMPAYQSISFSLTNLSETELQYLVDHLKSTMTNEQSEPD